MSSDSICRSWDFPANPSVSSRLRPQQLPVQLLWPGVTVPALQAAWGYTVLIILAIHGYPTNIHRPLFLSSSAEIVVVRPGKIIQNPVEASHSWKHTITRIQASVPCVTSLRMVASAISWMTP